MNATWPYGVDVSNWQQLIDWDAVAGAGYQFGFAKASEGTYYVDPYLGRNWSEMQRVGISRGAYHFARPDESDPISEADWFLMAIGDQGLAVGDLLALDLEVGYGDLGPWAVAFCERLSQRLSFPPLLYTSSGFINEHGLARMDLTGSGLWLAHWTEQLPDPPHPWSYLAVWQFTDSLAVPGIAGGVDGDRCPIGLPALVDLGAPAEIAPPEPIAPLPVYDWQEPARLQENDWDCSCESMEWCLYSYGRTPDDNWIEQSMIAEGVVSPEVGCLDASGAGLAAWANRHYGPDGYLADNLVGVSFDQLAHEASLYQHPVAVGGRAWYHWSGVRGYDAANELLLLANPAPGWQGVGQTMSRGQFNQWGPFNAVRLTHPAAEGGSDVSDTTPWEGKVGSGLLEMMTADNTLPAQRESTWLPLGHPPPSDIEECVGQNGTLYRWLLDTNQGFRYRPS
jgi:hypothetical protein